MRGQPGEILVQGGDVVVVPTSALYGGGPAGGAAPVAIDFGGAGGEAEDVC